MCSNKKWQNPPVTQTYIGSASFSTQLVLIGHVPSHRSFLPAALTKSSSKAARLRRTCDVVIASATPRMPQTGSNHRIRQRQHHRGLIKRYRRIISRARNCKCATGQWPQFKHREGVGRQGSDPGHTMTHQLSALERDRGHSQKQHILVDCHTTASTDCSYKSTNECSIKVSLLKLLRADIR